MNTPYPFRMIAPNLIDLHRLDPEQTQFQLLISIEAARREGFHATADALADVARYLAQTLAVPRLH